MTYQFTASFASRTKNSHTLGKHSNIEINKGQIYHFAIDSVLAWMGLVFAHFFYRIFEVKLIIHINFIEKGQLIEIRIKSLNKLMSVNSVG